MPEGVEGKCPGVKGPANISLLMLSPRRNITGETPNPGGMNGDGPIAYGDIPGVPGTPLATKDMSG